MKIRSIASICAVSVTLGTAGGEEVGLVLNDWYSSCEYDATDSATPGECAGTTTPGTGDGVFLDLSGNFFCYVNRIEEVKSQVTWFSACPGIAADCDVAELSDIKVYTMYLNPNNDMYNSLLPTECIDGACSFPKSIQDIRGETWWEDMSWCNITGQNETDLPYYCSVDPPDEVAFGNCSIYKRQPVPWNSTYCSIQASIGIIEGGTFPPTPAPTSESHRMNVPAWVATMTMAATLATNVAAYFF